MTLERTSPGYVRAYDYFVEAEGVPVFTGFSIPQLSEVELGYWERKGGRGAVVRLEGAEDVNGSYVMEIAPGSELKPQRHMYEEFLYIAEGRGATRVWNGQGHEVTFEWQAGSLFAIPLNCNYQHFNGSGTEPVRYYAVNSAPLMMNLIHNFEFIFGLDYDFLDRFGGEADYFTSEGRLAKDYIWETNFIPDVRAMELHEWKHRGAGSTMNFEMADSSLTSHISEFPVGTYKKAHRHGPGAHILIQSGEGFSLLWQEGGPMRRVDWRPGSVIVPPDLWFHQHFNTGPIPARYFAMRWGGKKYPVFKQYLDQGGDQIDYQDEDPIVRKMFEEELAKNGVTSLMGEVIGE